MEIVALGHMQKYPPGSFNYIKVMLSTLMKSNRNIEKLEKKKLKVFLVYKLGNLVHATPAVWV